MAGIVLSKREMTTKTGNRMAFLMLSDSDGTFEVTFFSETLGVLRPLLDANVPLLISIEAQPKDDDWRPTATGVQAPDQAIAKAGAHFKVFLHDAAAVPPLRTMLRSAERRVGEQWAVTGRCRGGRGP